MTWATAPRWMRLVAWALRLSPQKRVRGIFETEWSRNEGRFLPERPPTFREAWKGEWYEKEPSNGS